MAAPLIFFAKIHTNASNEVRLYMNKIELILLKKQEDEELAIIKENYSKPAVERFVDINKDTFWTYVTETENVHFYKVYNEGILSGTVQCEVYDGVLYLALVVFPEYQNNGIGTDIVKFIIDGNTRLDFNEIRVSVDEKNTASMRLFQNAGFIKIGQKDELVDLQYIM